MERGSELLQENLNQDREDIMRSLEGEFKAVSIELLEQAITARDFAIEELKRACLDQKAAIQRIADYRVNNLELERDAAKNVLNKKREK
jgi:hypothetical protein